MLGTNMRHSRISSRPAAIAAALVLVALVAGVRAARANTDTGNINVTATVGASCVITTFPLAFGSYAPLGANASTPLDASGSLNVQCTGGSGSGVGLGDGLYFSTSRRMSDGVSSFLSYELYQDSGRTKRWGDAILAQRYTTGFPFVSTGTLSIPIYGRIPAGQLVSAGTFSDTVAATVYF
jgi:spore coat protein U-like protein